MRNESFQPGQPIPYSAKLTNLNACEDQQSELERVARADGVVAITELAANAKLQATG